MLVQVEKSLFRKGKNIDGDMKNPIETHSSKSCKIKNDHEECSYDVISSDDVISKAKKINEDLKKPIKIHSRNSLKLKKDRDLFLCQFLKFARKKKDYMLLYVDRIQCKQMPFVRRFPVINFWTSDQLKFRESKKLDNGGFGNGVDVANCNKDFESGSILDLYKKVEMTLQKRGNHKNFQFYRLKLQEIVSVISKFQQSEVKNDSSSDSFRRKISFEEDSFIHHGKEIGKMFLNEDIASFDLGIESEIYTPKKHCLSSDHEMQEKSISKVVFDSPVNVLGKNLHVPSSLSKRDQINRHQIQGQKEIKCYLQ
ncbi:unnamed protein product [Lactuca virosa]|uniref:Uncharacterized protein n=1 Tax=Lactuca virosa TaxID=75947 RepID=A0AAU9LNF1_9ASTR|nr:unnamed protein product [Lactuca virosa]